MDEQQHITPGRLWSGNEANASVRSLAERRKGNVASGDAISTGIKFVDDGNPPLTRGDLAVIVGMTSEGKSMLATTIAKHTIDEIKNGTRSEKGAVVIVLTEETIEARRIQMWGDHRVSIRSVLTGSADLEIIDQNIAKSTDEPLYFIGDCAGGDINIDEDETLGSLTVRRIAASVQALVRAGIVPELVLIDHVHDLATEKIVSNEQETYELIARQVVQFSNWLRRYCPLVIAAQAKKEVMTRAPKDRMPTKYDLKYLTAVSGRARDIYSIWYPLYHMEKDARLKTALGDTSVASGMFISSMVKGRYADIVGRPYPLTSMDESGHWSGMLRQFNANIQRRGLAVELNT